MQLINGRGDEMGFLTVNKFQCNEFGFNTVSSLGLIIGTRFEFPGFYKLSNHSDVCYVTMLVNNDYISSLCRSGI
jgi:hypothetical protein